MQEARKRFLFKLLLNLESQNNKKDNFISSAGFTLLETLITLVIVAILFAISASTWTALLNNQRLNQGNQKVFSLFQDTKTKARKQNQSYQLRFRNNTNNGLQYIIVSENATPDDREWQNLFDNKKDSVELYFYSPNTTNINELKIQTFNYQGVPADEILDVSKRIIVKPKDGQPINQSSLKCVIVEDLLGTLKVESDETCVKDNSGNIIADSQIQSLN